MTVPLPPLSPFSTRLHEYLKNHERLNGGGLGLPPASYLASPVATIRRVPSAGSKPLQCWFNVEAQVNAGTGTAVFGWALWEDVGANICMAQPHAVLAKPNGDMVCVTPSEPGAGKLRAITFFADPRIPFDYSGFRVPHMLCLKTDGPTDEGIEFVWIGLNRKAVWVKNAWQGPEVPDNFEMATMVQL